MGPVDFELSGFLAQMSLPNFARVTCGSLLAASRAASYCWRTADEFSPAKA